MSRTTQRLLKVINACNSLQFQLLFFSNSNVMKHPAVYRLIIKLNQKIKKHKTEKLNRTIAVREQFGYLFVRALSVATAEVFWEYFFLPSRRVLQ